MTIPALTIGENQPGPMSVPTDRRCPFDPPDGLGELRDTEPLSRVTLPSGEVGWLVTGHELARQVMGDARFTRLGPTSLPPEQHAALIADAIQHDPNFPAGPRETAERCRREDRLTDVFRDPEFVEALRLNPPNALPFFMMDPQPHNQMRRVLTGHFTVRRIERHRERIDQIVSDRLGAVERSGPPVDLVEAYAMPIALSMTCMLLGVPESESATFEAISSRREKPGASVDEILAANQEFRAFAAQQIDRKRAQPADDLLSDLMASGKMTDDDLVVTTLTLLEAAHTTTAATISLAVATLLRDRKWWTSLATESATTIGSLIEELMRYNTLIQTNLRIALEDIVIGEQVIRANETVVLSLPAANRDPKVFANPDHIDPSRPAIAQHVSFGYGIHQCLGQHLARMTVSTALIGLAHRFPQLDTTAPITDLPWSGDIRTFSPQRLPVTW